MGEENRVLTLDEVLTLPDGARVWVEINPENAYKAPAQHHEVKHTTRFDVYDTYDHLLLDEDGSYWGITGNGQNEDHFGVVYRVWLREPTAEELAANPWPTPIVEV